VIGKPRHCRVDPQGLVKSSGLSYGDPTAYGKSKSPRSLLGPVADGRVVVTVIVIGIEY
jgi:hypothetical protein